MTLILSYSVNFVIDCFLFWRNYTHNKAIENVLTDLFVDFHIIFFYTFVKGQSTVSYSSCAIIYFFIDLFSF